jgi:hypothetical protein
MSRTSKAWEALQSALKQTRETVTRSSRVDIVGGGVDEINPPEDIDEFAEQAKTNTIARANLRKFVHDVWEPGVRLEGPDDTVQYFEGDREDIDAAPPEETPEGGFLEQAGIYAGERYSDFYDFGKECTWQRWARGTVLVEYLKQDPTDAESQISGFSFIRPETVYPQVENNTNILLAPDFEDLPGDISERDVDMTKRDEVAAYIQFDDESILGLRRNGFDEQDIPLSQNDVLKQTLEPDIGGDVQQGEGVFGTSALESVSEDIEEYEQTKRDRFEASQRKAYGVWTAQFKPETIDLGDAGTEIIEWTEDSIQDTENELNQMGPGDVLSSDANIDLERHSGNVPDLEPMLMHYVNEISSALPTPLPLAVDFAGDINRDVTSDQREAYQDTISEERQTQEKSWTQAFKLVAERIGLPIEGLQMKIQPQKEDNPVKSLDTEEIDRMNTYVQALSAAAGPTVGPTALVDREELLDVLDFPVDAEAQADMADEIGDMADTEAARQAWNDIMDVEALATLYDEGDTVDTPDGLGVVSEIRTENFTGPDGDEVEASEDSPAYVVAVEDEDTMAGTYTASDMETTEFPEVDVENPTEALEAWVDIEQATYESLQDGFFSWPESWQDSEQPARLIALKAWAGMGGRHTGCVREMRGNVGRPNAFCADFKDRILGWEGWRQ